MTALGLIEELARFVAENGDAEVRFAKSCNMGEPYWHIEAVKCSLEISENDSDAEDVCVLLPRKESKA